MEFSEDKKWSGRGSPGTLTDQPPKLRNYDYMCNTTDRIERLLLGVKKL